MTSLDRSVSVRKPSGRRACRRRRCAASRRRTSRRRRPGSTTPVIHGPRTSSSPTALAVARHDRPVRADQAGLDGGGEPALRDAVRARPPRPVDAGRDAGDRAQRRGLGHPPRMDHVDAVPLRRRPSATRGQAEPPTIDLPQRRHVPRCSSRWRQQPGPDGRHRRRPGWAASTAIIAASGSGAEEAVRHDQGGAAHHRGVRRAPGQHVEHRHDQQHPVGLRHARSRRACRSASSAGRSTGGCRRHPWGCRSCRSCSTWPRPQSRSSSTAQSNSSGRPASSSS